MANKVVVSRERELAALNTFLDRAVDGQGQVCFVTGEAGAGKTVLIAEFVRRAQDAHPDLIVAVGQCDARTGVGDPYLPFREAMALLTGDVEAKLAQGAISEENAGRLREFVRVSGQAVVDLGPDLIDIFVPGVGLATRAGTYLAGKAGWLDRLNDLTERKTTGSQDIRLDQSHIFEQYTDVLEALAAQQPLVIVIDDLQWADAGSTELLFRLGRRVQKSRLLIIGAYRPDDVALGRGGERHPLEPALNELKRYRGNIWIDLARAQKTTGRQFVDALLDTEPNRLGEDFRQALFERTGGYPLFTVELIRDLQDRGDLTCDEEGRWVHERTLDWEMLPARVEGVIEERIGRLEAELRDILTIASVEGEDFTAEVVARVRTADERGLIRRLSGELEKQHQLVHAEGTRRLGRQRLSRFRFRHQLFQTYLYNSLNEAEQAYLHEDVGTVLEALYGDEATDIAIQLAWHFREAGLDEKAFGYLRIGAQRAARSYAYLEAEDLYRQAIEVAQRLDVPGPELIGLYSARGRVLEHAGQYEMAVDAYRDLERLAQQRNDKAMEGAAISRLVTCYAEPTDMHSPELAKPLIERGLILARDTGDHDLESWLLWSETVWANHYGTTAQAQAAGEASIAIARRHGRHERLAFVLNDLAINLRLSGDLEQGQAYSEEARRLFREMDNQPMLADNLNQQAWNDYQD